VTAGGLRRFREPAPTSGSTGGSAPADVRRCELCAEPVGESHGHVVNLESRALLCSCRNCQLLFAAETVTQRRYRAVPERYLYMPAFRMSETDWTELQIPVRMAFFFANSVLGRSVACYPSPGGAIECELPLATWERVLAANPELADARPDVEALLVDRTAAGFTCHLVPIDACYELIGLVRLTWKGFAGGQEAWDAIDDFFASLRRRSREVATDVEVPDVEVPDVERATDIAIATDVSPRDVDRG
jgi:uncharacterized protein DUF5947